MTQDVSYFQEKLKKGLTASLRLSLTSDIRLESMHASIFNHPMNEVHLTIYGGSGRFLVKGSDDDIAMVTATKSIVKVSTRFSVTTVHKYKHCLIYEHNACFIQIKFVTMNNGRFPIKTSFRKDLFYKKSVMAKNG